jgi:hypothetical protein
MKITLEQNGTVVTIETKGDGQTGDQMAQFCRELLLAQGYHWNTVTQVMPTEEDVVEIISDAINEQKEFDSDEILVHPTA